MRSSMAASDPHWPYRFWRDVESLNTREGLEYEVKLYVEWMDRWQVEIPVKDNKGKKDRPAGRSRPQPEKSEVSL